MKRFALALALSLTCCGSPVEPAQDETAPAPQALEGVAELEGCGMVFSPVPELLDATEDAAARWSAATGCDVRAGDGGVPILSLAEVIKLDGGSETARALFDEGFVPNRIEIRSDHPDPVRGLTHEMGHILGGHGHSLTGAMQSGNSSRKPIDLASLLLVCSNLNCAAITPER